jgi:hypothetical protein
MRTLDGARPGGRPGAGTREQVGDRPGTRAGVWIRCGALMLALGLSGCGGGEPSGDPGEVSGGAPGRTLETPAPDAVPGATPSTGAVPPSPSDAVREAADQVLDALAGPDLPRLAALAHPERGILFSPYAYVEPGEAVVLTPDELLSLQESDPVRSWGWTDGSGEPIQLTFQSYHGEYIYERDFRAAPRVSVDDRIGVGTTVDNIAQQFPGATTVEYHIPGVDPALEGMDWASLRLVLIREDERWWLVAVVHDQWTT